MADKQKEAKEVKGFLSEEAREKIINTLKDGGVETEGLTDEDLLTKLQTDYTSIKKIKDDLIASSEEKNSLAKKLNSYLNTPDSLLTDKAFVARLFNLGVPECFLKLFRDADTTFTDAKIWEVVRYSGIKVYDHDLSEVLSRRRKVSKNVRKEIQRRLG